MKEFLEIEGLLFDVRSPSEFLQGHIPGAINLPLLDDEQRASVGTCYKQEGQQSAITLGLECVTPKINTLLDQVRQHNRGGIAKLYCWRGGMRSQSVGELLKWSGIPSKVLMGGYKTFRKYGAGFFSSDWKLQVIGGMTGTGKTEILHALKDRGEQVLDLEALANHRGSAFGMLGMGKQPTTEHFHNLITMELMKCDPTRPLFVEDESRLIGSCHLPEDFYEKMQKSPLKMIQRPLRERLEILNRGYGVHSNEDVVARIHKLDKKLGSKNTQEVIALIHQGKRLEAAAIILEYYDKTYQYCLSKRPQPPDPLSYEGLSAKEWAHKLMTNNATSIQ